MKTNHKEAFCLMQYKCKCGHQELAWNSRDGVTPFGINCPSCGSPELTHDNFHLDSCTPNHKPHRGQLVFRDGTKDEALAILKKRIEHFKIPELEARKLITGAFHGDYPEFRQGWPMVTRHNTPPYEV